MVGEFPELQGVMGGYYARHDGEPDAVADAVRDHYAPKGPADPVPTAPVTIAVALADKIDQLAAFFAVGEVPTGSGDPYALRRAALGIIRIIRENRLRLPLLKLFHEAATRSAGRGADARRCSNSSPTGSGSSFAPRASGTTCWRRCSPPAPTTTSSGCWRARRRSPLPRHAGRRRPAHRRAPGRQHPADRGQEGRAASRRHRRRSAEGAGRAGARCRARAYRGGGAGPSGPRTIRRGDGCARASSPNIGRVLRSGDRKRRGNQLAAKSTALACPCRRCDGPRRRLLPN